MTARWGHDTIALTTAAGPVSVEADTYGSWAVHDTPGALVDIFSWGWTITHIPTGLAVTKGIASKARARRLCREVARIVGDTPITGAKLPREISRQLFALLSAPAAVAGAAGGRDGAR